ncbi:unnamed protein product, partial [Adineta steineri]
KLFTPNPGRWFLKQDSMKSPEHRRTGRFHAGLFDLEHGSPLMFNNDERPFHRLLALYCYSAFTNTKLKQREFGLKDEELNNITFYVNNLLELKISLNEDTNEYV